MTKAEMRGKVRWIMDQLGLQWMPDTASSDAYYSLDLALAEGIAHYAEDTEAYSVKYSMTTTAFTTTPSEALYTLGQFSGSADPTMGLSSTPWWGGPSNGARMFAIEKVFYNGKELDAADVDEQKSTTLQTPATPWRWIQTDWQTIKIWPPPNAALPLMIEGLVVPDTTAFVANTAATAVWSLANILDQPTPCYWAAIELLPRTQSKENEGRRAWCQTRYDAGVAKAQGRINKRRGPIRRFRRQHNRGLYLPDGITVNQASGSDLDT